MPSIPEIDEKKRSARRDRIEETFLGSYQTGHGLICMGGRVDKTREGREDPYGVHAGQTIPAHLHRRT